MFARLINLLDDENLNYNEDEISKYYIAYEYIVASNREKEKIINNESEIRVCGSYFRILDYIKFHLENMLSA